MKSDVEDLMPRLLPVENYDVDDFDPSIPPRNPQEYLRQVQLEAAKCPDVVVAQIDPKKLQKRQTVNVSLSTCQPAPDGYSPSLKWQQIQVANFSAVRQSVVKHRAHWQAQALDENVMMPKVEDDEGWKKFCLGENVYFRRSAIQDVMNEEMGIDYVKVGFPPLLSIVSRLNQSVTTHVLEYLITWFEEEEFSPELLRPPGTSGPFREDVNASAASRHTVAQGPNLQTKQKNKGRGCCPDTAPRQVFSAGPTLSALIGAPMLPPSASLLEQSAVPAMEPLVGSGFVSTSQTAGFFSASAEDGPLRDVRTQWHVLPYRRNWLPQAASSAYFGTPRQFGSAHCKRADPALLASGASRGRSPLPSPLCLSVQKLLQRADLLLPVALDPTPLPSLLTTASPPGGHIARPAATAQGAAALASPAKLPPSRKKQPAVGLP
ncbi:GEMI2 protein, partial [Polypterus senegalus]